MIALLKYEILRFMIARGIMDQSADHIGLNTPRVDRVGGSRDIEACGHLGCLIAANAAW